MSFRKSKSLSSLVHLVLGWPGWRGSRGIHPYREWECKSLCKAETGCAQTGREVMGLLVSVELRSPEKQNSPKWKKS